MAKSFDAQIGHKEVLFIFCGGSSLGFFIMSQILLQLFESYAYRFTNHSKPILSSIQRQSKITLLGVCTVQIAKEISASDEEMVIP